MTFGGNNGWNPPGAPYGAPPGYGAPAPAPNPFAGGAPGSFWSGMKDAEIYGQGNYLEAGHRYDVRVDRCMVKSTQQKGPAFIAEFTVINSTSAKHPPGSFASFFQGNFAQYRATALSSVKEFVAAVLGVDPRDKARMAEVEASIEPLMDRVTGQENLLGARIVHVETTTKTTKTNRKEITVHRWAPFTGDPHAAAHVPVAQAPAAPPAPAQGAPQYGPPPAPQYGPPGAPTPPYGPPPGPPPAYAPAPQAPQAPAYGPPAGYAPPVQGGQPAGPPSPVWDPNQRRYVLP